MPKHIPAKNWEYRWFPNNSKPYRICFDPKDKNEVIVLNRYRRNPSYPTGIWEFYGPARRWVRQLGCHNVLIVATENSLAVCFAHKRDAVEFKMLFQGVEQP